MAAHPRRALRRVLTLAATSALAAGFAVASGATPAVAAVGAPTGLRTADRECAAEAPGPYLNPAEILGVGAVVLRGAVTGAAPGAELVADFEVWDVARPEHRQQWPGGTGEGNGEVYVELSDHTKQLDGVTYAWRVRVLDGADASPWSATCHFTVDRTRGDEPVVTSAQYPAGGWAEPRAAVGVPGVFRLSTTTPDIVSYRYRLYSIESGGEVPWSTVEPAEPGGPAEFRWTSKVAGGHALSVRSVDRAGNLSAEVQYDFHVAETRPVVWSRAYPDWSSNLDYNVGVRGAFTFSSTVAGTASFAWRLDGGPSGSVPADAEGEATAMIAPTRAGRQTLHVRSVTRDGTAHAERPYEFVVDNGPRLTGDTDRGAVIGSSLTFHLAPRAPHVTAYVYWQEHEGWPSPPVTKVTIPARADGTADLTWTATDTSVRGLMFQSRSADGTLSEPRWNHLSVDGAAPRVTRSGGDELGTEATFTVRSAMADVVGYVVVFNGDEATKRVVAPRPDGVATFGYTSPKGGHNDVTVVARNAAGVRSVAGVVAWNVDDRPRVTSADFPATGAGRLAAGSFVFTPRLPGTATYVYSFDSGPYRSIAAEPDGTATLTWTPDEAGAYQLDVWSRLADGTYSWPTRYTFTVRRGTATVTGVTPASVAGGGTRTVTVRGTSLHHRDTVEVTPAGHAALTAKVTAVSADGTTMTAEVDVPAATAGRASITVRPYGGASAPAVLTDALTITPAALRATAAPTVTGTVAVGRTVTATAGTWTPAATSYAYRWAADGTTIAGATGASYRVTPAVLGKRLTVTVTASRAGHPSGSSTSAASATVAKGKAPEATTAPAVTGTARVGRTVQAAAGTWSPTADSYTYEWRVDGDVVGGARSASLRLTSSMRDKRLTVTVTAKRAGHADGAVTSAAVTVRR
jgi:hypothetical protein